MCLKMPTTTACNPNNMEANETPRGSLEDSKDPPVSVDDDIEPASEVKVYTNEEEEDEVPETEKRDRNDDLKSSLINESEQCKDARTGDQLAFASKSILMNCLKLEKRDRNDVLKSILFN